MVKLQPLAGSPEAVLKADQSEFLASRRGGDALHKKSLREASAARHRCERPKIHRHKTPQARQERHATTGRSNSHCRRGRQRRRALLALPEEQALHQVAVLPRRAGPEDPHFGLCSRRNKKASVDQFPGQRPSCATMAGWSPATKEQISSNALEAARVACNKYLIKMCGKEAYHIFLRLTRPRPPVALFSSANGWIFGRTSRS